MDSSNNTEQLPEDASYDVKGDTIGDTAYSQRFVLSMLIKLISIEKLSEDDLNEFVEKDLCILWDMTSEKDVIDFLLTQNAIGIFNNILTERYSPRITEVLIGTLANMCSSQGAIREMNTNVNIRKSVYNYITCDDSLTILQIMRFISSNIYDSSEYLESWVQFLIENDFSATTSYILSNSTNESLLSNTFEVINCLCCTVKDSSSKTLLKRMFVNRDFVKSLLIGFEELTKVSQADDSEALERIENVFLSIHSILTGFQVDSHNAYQESLPSILKVINTIIRKYVESNNPALVDIIEYLTTCLPILYDSESEESKELFNSILSLWKNTVNLKPESDNSSDFDENINLSKELKQLLPQYFVRIFEPLTKENLKQLLQGLDQEELKTLSDNIVNMIQSGTIHHYFNKVTVVLDSISN